MEQLINFIIRPPRAEYNPKNDLLDQEFMLKGKWYQRKDVEVVNSRGDVLQCSHYLPIVPPEGKTLPCVIYCHGNSGCRTDASEAAIILLPSNITVFTLDFSGSGLSGGEFVTLGCNEKDDLKAVVDYLRADGNVSFIGLWGRSMGAVTSLMYGARDPSIAGMVLDSPFSDLTELMMELVDTYRVRLPKFTVKFAIQYMRRAIQKKAKFDINDLNTIKVAKSSFVPVLFGHANDDDFIQPHHSDRIFEAYVGDKNIIKFEGDHNSPRPEFYFDSICIFFNNVLQPPEDEVGNAYIDFTHDYYNKDNWGDFHEVEDLHELSGSPSGPAPSNIASNSSEAAIKQLRRFRRPMSSTVVPSDIASNDKEQDDKVESTGSSSSNMISFDLSNGSHPGSHLSTSMDDAEYVEYPLDTLANFPSNVEEEERMFMEAILESMKGMEAGPSKSTDDVVFKSKPTLENGSIKASSLENEEQKMESQMLHVNLNKLLLDSPRKCTTSEVEKTQVTAKTSSHDQNLLHSNGNLTTTKSILGTSNESSSDNDMVDRTRVVLQVEKNPTNNIMDGLLRRWDLFKGK